MTRRRVLLALLGALIGLSVVFSVDAENTVGVPRASITNHAITHAAAASRRVPPPAFAVLFATAGLAALAVGRAQAATVRAHSSTAPVPTTSRGPPTLQLND